MGFLKFICTFMPSSANSVFLRVIKRLWGAIFCLCRVLPVARLYSFMNCPEWVDVLS